MIRLLNDLALTVPLPPVVQQGSHLVGDGFANPDFRDSSSYGEVRPGTYRATFVENCFWETVGETGDTIDNDFIGDAPQVIIDIPADAYAFINDCDWLVPVEWVPPATAAPATTSIAPDSDPGRLLRRRLRPRRRQRPGFRSG